MVNISTFGLILAYLAAISGGNGVPYHPVLDDKEVAGYVHDLDIIINCYGNTFDGSIDKPVTDPITLISEMIRTIEDRLNIDTVVCRLSENRTDDEISHLIKTAVVRIKNEMSKQAMVNIEFDNEIERLRNDCAASTTTVTIRTHGLLSSSPAAESLKKRDKPATTSDEQEQQETEVEQEEQKKVVCGEGEKEAIDFNAFADAMVERSKTMKKKVKRFNSRFNLMIHFVVPPSNEQVRNLRKIPLSPIVSMTPKLKGKVLEIQLDNVCGSLLKMKEHFKNVVDYDSLRTALETLETVYWILGDGWYYTIPSQLSNVLVSVCLWMLMLDFISKWEIYQRPLLIKVDHLERFFEEIKYRLANKRCTLRLVILGDKNANVYIDQKQDPRPDESAENIVAQLRELGCDMVKLYIYNRGTIERMLHTLASNISVEEYHSCRLAFRADDKISAVY